MKKSMIAALFGMAVVVLTADHALAGRGGGGGSRGGSGAMRGQSAMRGQMNGQQQMYQQRMQQQQAYQQQAYQQQMRNRYRYGSQGGQFMQQGGQPLLGDQNNTVQQQTIMQQQWLRQQQRLRDGSGAGQRRAAGTGAENQTRMQNRQGAGQGGNTAIQARQRKQQQLQDCPAGQAASPTT